MQLDEFFDYKNELMKRLCCNPKIVRLVTDSDEAPVPNYDLAYTQIFPFEHIPEIVDDGKTFICFDVDIASVIDKTYYVPVVYVWAFTHESKMRMSEGGVRLDNLAVEINKELNGSRYFGLGELDLSSVTRFVPQSGYLGRALAYKALDFNRLAPSQKPPVNRKQRV